MFITDDVHRQFAEFFEEKNIWPYAYLLSKRLTEGNICIPATDPKSNIESHPYASVVPATELLEYNRLVSNASANLTPFVLYNERLYFQRYFSYETNIIGKIKELIASESNTLPERINEVNSVGSLISSLQTAYDITGLPVKEQIDWQLVSVLQALLQNFTIITGGPGTGKTTTLAKLLITLFALRPNARVALAAPTGKASMRMYESLKNSQLNFNPETKAKIEKLNPGTLHSLLGYKKESVNFKYNENNPLPFDWVIVDEASMIDVPMFSKLLGALGSNCRIILLGDKDQLASVEAGSLLGDLCQTLPALNEFTLERATWLNKFITDSDRQIQSDFIKEDQFLLSGHIIELKFSHRFNSQGSIGKISKAIIASETNTITNFISAASDSKLHFDLTYQAKTIEEFTDGYAAFIQEPDITTALKKLNELRVLVAVREGPHGLYAVNRLIETHLRSKGLLKPDGDIYENRPIMVTKNMYELGLFNGDIGILRYDQDRNLRAWFEGGETGTREILPAYLTSTETVFAMTIHKSQGSEFNKVMVILPEGIDNQLLTRELLYTAVTRAKSEITIQGTAETIIHAASRSVERISGITGRIDDNK
jgi:exodeoxyribonuclease V alpha subunit